MPVFAAVTTSEEIKIESILNKYRPDRLNFGTIFTRESRMLRAS